MSSEPLSRVLAAVLLLTACSVKENRKDCPCELVLAFSDLRVSPVMAEVSGGDFARTQIVASDTVLALSVPKGEMAVSVVGGALRDPLGGVRIPVGEEAPPLYLFHASVSTDAEQVVLPVVLRKQFCILDLAFTGPPGYGQPFEVEIEGEVDGWNPDGTPAEGAFSRRILPDAQGHAVLRLPRQRDDSLRMHVVFSDRVVRTFALGSYIAAAGYDWGAPDLEDLTLGVDISVTSVTISSDGWSSSEEIDLWI